MDKKEYWTELEQFPSYEASSYGRIRRKPPKVHLVRGYPHVYLRGHNHYVHSLVLSAFKGPRPEGYHAHHKNGVRTDNREWVPMHEHLHEHDLGENNPHAVLTVPMVDEIVRLRKQHQWGATLISRHLGLNRETVQSVLRGKSWGWHTGYPNDS